MHVKSVIWNFHTCDLSKIQVFVSTRLYVPISKRQNRWLWKKITIYKLRTTYEKPNFRSSRMSLLKRRFDNSVLYREERKRIFDEQYVYCRNYKLQRAVDIFTISPLIREERIYMFLIYWKKYRTAFKYSWRARGEYLRTIILLIVRICAQLTYNIMPEAIPVELFTIR